MQQRERDRTGIASLKIGYNKVFGYYIEVTNPHLARVPTDFERRQTLATAERYVTPELKDYEARVLGAEERMAEREAELFAELRSRVGAVIARIQQTARILARADVWTTLAEVAVANRYARPSVSAGFDITLIASRHAVIERGATGSDSSSVSPRATRHTRLSVTSKQPRKPTLRTCRRPTSSRWAIRSSTA